MADYKTCAVYQKGICPMANSFANNPNVKLDCSKCKSYIAAKNDQQKQNIAAEIFKAQNHNTVSHPAHYTSGGIECIDCIKAALGENFMGFLIGNVIKYTYRYKHKNGIEDLKKARWYLDRAIKELTENAEE